MRSRTSITKDSLRAFSSAYDTQRESAAQEARGEFLETFPLESLPTLRLDDYVVGHKTPTFCTYVEARTSQWARIQGATSFKFGIYFGVTKSDKTPQYRFTKKFGQTKEKAFRKVRASIVDLVRTAAATPIDFAAIDRNPLSQMFKAKILSLYFPDDFINICSSEHLEMLGSELGMPDNLFVSEYQRRLVKLKQSSAVTRGWSNPKYMAYLYETYVRGDDLTNSKPVEKARKKISRKVNFEEIQAQRDKIGKAAEEFALAWERRRLIGAGLGHLVSKISDRREYPGTGYDFGSFNTPSVRRLIEVKAVGKLPKGEGYRFFLSSNERAVSEHAQATAEYYFYLVFFDGKGKPQKLIAIISAEVYPNADLLPVAFQVQFDLTE